MIELNEKDQYLLSLASELVGLNPAPETIKDHTEIVSVKEVWQKVRESELEEAMDDGQWKKHYPANNSLGYMGRDKVRGLLRQEVLDALGRLESLIRAAETTTAVLSSTHSQ